MGFALSGFVLMSVTNETANHLYLPHLSVTSALNGYYIRILGNSENLQRTFSL